MVKLRKTVKDGNEDGGESQDVKKGEKNENWEKDNVDKDTLEDGES